MIKNFVYLDEEKMFSLSSQIFEGITEYVLNESSADNEQSEQQKGPVGSGRLLGDVIRNSDRTTEKKFLHDYAFTIFEKHLCDAGKVFELTDSSSFDLNLEEHLESYSFIKVKAKATFNDADKISRLFSNYNKMGEAIVCMNINGKLKELNELYEQAKLKPSYKANKKKIDQDFKENTDISKIARKSGFYFDPVFLENLNFILDYGYSDQFEVILNKGGYIFSSSLKKGNLRESEDLLIRKYSRKTEREIVIFGLITQSFSSNAPVVSGDTNFPNSKAAFMNLVEALTGIENSFSGKQANEVVIDPVAVYFEA